MKTITDKNFIDWFAENFGYGYGSGELYILPALKGFLEVCPETGNYDFRVIENKIGGFQCWFLMNTLCKENIIEYGTSPRFGWLTEKGKLLKEYLAGKTADNLYELVMVDSDYVHCMSNACNCGKNGYVEGKKCDNPLF
jgi:hypothetical protein